MINWFKRNAIHFGIISIFIVLCFIYFSPVFQGKVLSTHDVMQAQATQKEIMDYKARDGVAPLWTNSMFGGMPAYQIWAQYPKNVLTYVNTAVKTIFPNPIDTVFLLLIGAYLLFCLLKAKPWLAAAGSIAFAFSAYNFSMIEAGHANQALAIAYFAPTLAGIIITFRGRYLLGAAITAFFLALELRANHIQMTYYLFLAVLILVGIEIYHAVKEKAIRRLLTTAGYLVGALIIAVGVNAGSLWTTYEYGQKSTRGPSNLTTEKSQPNNGLDREYAYGWSQGVSECITFLVPNAYGGSSNSQALDENSEVAKTIIQRGAPADQALGFAKQMPTYWGEKAYTAGPHYYGAITFFLFVFGLFIVRSRLKWWIAGAIVLTLLLSFGKNFPLVSDIFFNYFPLYNKFRAVESILAVTGLLFPILAVLAAREIAKDKIDVSRFQKSLQYSLYIVGGILLILIVLPTLFLDFKPSTHDQFLQQITQMVRDQDLANSIGNALIQDRVSMTRADAFRSLIFVLIAAGLVWAVIKNKIKAEYAYIGLAIAITVDMWGVNKRYLNNDKFVDATQTKQPFRPRQVDELILRDQSLNYRVLDLSQGEPFSNGMTSYFHKSLGGYHAAKLKRFQEVVEKQFSNSINEDVLDMLNTKYLITADQKSQSERIVNRSTACGNAWMASKVTYVKDADEEMEAISSFDPKQEAFVHNSFKTLIDEKKLGADPNGIIKLTSYHPDHLIYEYSAANAVLGVFAEVWYDKGWNAYVDGGKVPIIRADYLLRAAPLPAGNHKVEFKFEPASYYTGENISMIFSIILVAGILAAFYFELKRSEPEG